MILLKKAGESLCYADTRAEIGLLCWSLHCHLVQPDTWAWLSPQCTCASAVHFPTCSGALSGCRFSSAQYCQLSWSNQNFAVPRIPCNNRSVDISYLTLKAFPVLVKMICRTVPTTYWKNMQYSEVLIYVMIFTALMNHTNVFWLPFTLIVINYYILTKWLIVTFSIFILIWN